MWSHKAPENEVLGVDTDGTDGFRPLLNDLTTVLVVQNEVLEVCVLP